MSLLLFPGYWKNRFTIGLNKRGEWGVIDTTLKKVARFDRLDVVCDTSKDLNGGGDRPQRYDWEKLDESWNVAKDER